MHNNTCWHNNRNKLAYSNGHNEGDLSCVFSDHVTFADNISVADAKDWQASLTVAGSKNVTLANNLLNGPRCTADSTHVYENATLTSDPRFVNPSTDPAVADFHLQPGSPAKRSGAYAALK